MCTQILTNHLDAPVSKTAPKIKVLIFFFFHNWYIHVSCVPHFVDFLNVENISSPTLCYHVWTSLLAAKASTLWVPSLSPLVHRNASCSNFLVFVCYCEFTLRRDTWKTVLTSVVYYHEWHSSVLQFVYNTSGQSLRVSATYTDTLEKGWMSSYS